MSRKNLIPLLNENPLTVRQIATQLRVHPADVEDDLVHLEKSLAHSDQKLVVHPAVCRKCGFEFGPDKLRKPSRCPVCKASWLTEPEIEIRTKGEND
jgi:predicted Zn-ribbon and HTH transcriptional regulator